MVVTNNDVHIYESSVSSIKIELIRNKEQFDQIREEWTKLVEQAESYLFQTYEWQRNWWKYFGQPGMLHVLVFRENDEVIAIAPLFVDAIQRRGILNYRELRLIGTHCRSYLSCKILPRYSASDYMDFIVFPGREDEIARTFIQYLEMDKNEWNELVLTDVPEKSFIKKYLVTKLKSVDRFIIKERKSAVCPVIEVQGDWESFINQLSKKTRRLYRRTQNTIGDKEIYKLTDVDNPRDIEEAFRKFVMLDEQRNNSIGYPGLFDDWRFFHFLQELTKEFYNRRWLKFKVAKDSDGNILAVDFAVCFKNRLYSYQKKLDCMTSESKFNPGRVLMFAQLRDAFDNSMSVFNFLKGGHDYEYKTTNRVEYNWSIHIVNKNSLGVVEKQLINSMKAVISLVNRLALEYKIIGILRDKYGYSQIIGRYSHFLKNRIHHSTENED